jgi:FkbM family methyltransferase
MIKYGIPNHYIDVTELVVKLCDRLYDHLIMIPETEEGRTELFGDPVWGSLKHIVVNEEIIKTGQPRYIPSSLLPPFNFIGNPHKRLNELHSSLKFQGDLNQEYPEQVMSISFINPNDRVLELGSNIGRNTVIISSILNDSANLTTLETDPKNIETLTKNRDDNGFKFKIVNAALSKRKLWQRWWVTTPSDVSPGNDWFQVKTVELSEINNHFNVLVADCEGALYYILQDFPEILNGVETILVENDYRSMEHLVWVENLFKTNGFTLRYASPSDEARGYNLPSHRNFFQCWKR